MLSPLPPKKRLKVNVIILFRLYLRGLYRFLMIDKIYDSVTLKLIYSKRFEQIRITLNHTRVDDPDAFDFILFFIFFVQTLFCVVRFYTLFDLFKRRDETTHSLERREITRRFRVTIFLYPNKNSVFKST